MHTCTLLEQHSPSHDSPPSNFSSHLPEEVIGATATPETGYAPHATFSKLSSACTVHNMNVPLTAFSGLHVRCVGQQTQCMSAQKRAVLGHDQNGYCLRSGLLQ